ncbi:hypothetical protein AB0911_35795 [Streptomyces nigra]|uniref:hypothetical protein n=1 Tax=Streptomyces nigra TaxID=1827580 RepID=UPI0034513B1F
MHDEQRDDSLALTQLRARLAGGLVRIRLSKTDLASRAGLGRTTVSEAFQSGGPVPSAQTVAALASALKLPVEELQVLRRAAVGGGERPGPGRPIGEWGPHDLEVHPAGDAAADTTGAAGGRALPGYVRRRHDRVLADAVRSVKTGYSRIVVLVGSSSTGKTRACWEAVQPLADEKWRLWHPFDPTRAEAALEDLHRVQSRTVVWLNEAQHYLGDRVAGERIAAAVHTLLTAPECSPVLVLGTLWPEYAARYTVLPPPGGEDPHSRVRELLAGHTVSVPDTFDRHALASAAALALGGDRLLADALTRASVDGRVTQDLAGARELLNRYMHATPAARAVLQAAMDARRLGVGLHLPQAFLTEAAVDYLTDTDYDHLTEDWAEQVFAELAEPVHGKQAPLRRTTPRPRRRPPAPSSRAHTPPALPSGPLFRLADYLEQHGRTTRRHLCPDSSFWHAAHTHLTQPDDLDNLAQAALYRHRLQWAYHLRQMAAEHGSPAALYQLAEIQEQTGDPDAAHHLYRQAAEHGHSHALYRLAVIRQEAGDAAGAEALAMRAAEYGDSQALHGLAVIRQEAGDAAGAEALAILAADHGNHQALHQLTEKREQTGDPESAETTARFAADHGYPYTLYFLAAMREEAGDRKSAETLARLAADFNSTHALSFLAEKRQEAGDQKSAEDLYRRAAELGSAHALLALAAIREETGDHKGVEDLHRLAADQGNSDALYRLAIRRQEAGDMAGAEALAWQASGHGNAHAPRRLAMMREHAGDHDGAEALAREAAYRGNPEVLRGVAEMREEAGDHESAEDLYRLAAKRGSTTALYRLSMMREEAGDRDGAEVLARQVADRGNSDALYRLALRREQAGDRDAAEVLARQAADYGRVSKQGSVLTRMWPQGLDPDGTPTPSWR